MADKPLISFDYAIKYILRTKAITRLSKGLSRHFYKHRDILL
ncbi:hypothetical protein Bealeia2_02042 (plasmid) [Candidatus Bealeia paramacronuclearis]|nr:hypothetical protein [Candidatus Bealeia paramacronuclearis]